VVARPDNPNPEDWMIELDERAVAGMFANDVGGGRTAITGLFRDPERQGENPLRAEALAGALPWAIGA
jgi:hypothetical protein